MIKLSNILIPTDFSEHSERAGEYACELARRFGAAIHLLHVIESPIMAMPSPGAPLPDALLRDLQGDAEKQLHTWLSDQLKEVKEVTRLVKHGAPFVEIVRYGKDKNVDLIVLGTHGRGGLTHALIGSVAERVVRKAPCPVLTVRPHGHQFVMP